MKNIIENESIDYINKVNALTKDRHLRCRVYTFGCQQNEADSEKILGMASKMGYAVSDNHENCDLIVVNTCAIREHAEMKALSMLGNFKAQKRNNPDLIIAVVGCMAAEEHIVRKIKEDFHYISFTLEPSSIHRFPELVYKFISEGKRRFSLPTNDKGVVEGLPVYRRSSHRAWVSVMYGCNNFCSYCIVPYVRGRERSRLSSEIISECNELIRSGIKEITLLGQNVNSYRSDIGFAELVEKIALIDGDFLIRFMTSHPKDTSDELISVMGRYSHKISPFFHLPLQSGSDKILKEMNRTYTVKRYLEIVEKLRLTIPDIVLSTDVIVGFPGESEEDFLSTLDIVREVRFDNVYSFAYSKRSGTRAEKMPDQVPENIKKRRLEELLAVQADIAYEKNLPYLNNTYRVLLDSAELRQGSMVYSGRTPGGKLVHFSSDNKKVGEFVNVKITKIGAFDLIGVEE